MPRRADVSDHMDQRIRGLRPLPGNVKIIVCAVRIVAMLYSVQRTAYSGECLYSVQVPNMTQAVATGGSWGVEGTQARCDQQQCQCSVSRHTLNTNKDPECKVQCLASLHCPLFDHQLRNIWCSLL